MTKKESSTGKGGADENSSKSSAYDNSNSTEKQVTPPSEIENCEEVEACPDISALLDAIVIALNRHVSLPDHCAEAIALYVAFSHVVHVAQIAPRLALISPMQECGKTTLLTTISFLVSNPFPTSNTTPAVVFRAIDGMTKPTLLIDEADSFMDERAELANVIKGSHERVFAMVSRCGGDTHELQHFKTFCCMAIARIGSLPAALETRCIVIRMRKAKSSETIAKLTSTHRDSLMQVRKQLESWADSSAAVLEDADPKMPEGFVNRRADNWRPLFAIADVAGGDWPETARSAAQALSDVPEASNGEVVLAAIRKAMRGTIIGRISTADLCKKLFLTDNRILPPDGLAKALRPFGIKPKAMRIDGKSVRGYMLCDFEDAFTRYLTSVDDEGGRNED